MKKYLIFAVFLFSLVNCAKEPGLGGTSAIVGKLKLHNYNANFTILKQSYYLVGEEVFIIFGDDAIQGDRVKTGIDGTFEFRNLNPGKYTVYAYSKDSTFTSPSGEVPVMMTVEIPNDGELAQIGDLVVLDNSVKGYASIRGKVWVNNGSPPYYAPDERVYIIYDNNFTFETSQRTNYDGTYHFTQLPVGNYTLYAYTDDPSAPAGISPVFKTVTIDSTHQQIVLSDLIIDE